MESVALKCILWLLFLLMAECSPFLRIGLSQARFPTSCYRNPYAVSLSRPRIAETLLEDNATQSIIGLGSTGIKTGERLGAAYDVN